MNENWEVGTETGFVGHLTLSKGFLLHYENQSVDGIGIDSKIKSTDTDN